VTAEFQYRALPLRDGVPRVTEVKRHLDGRVGRFECELLARAPSLVVARFPLEARYGPVDSYGFFWPRRSYLVYHLVPREVGEPVRSRFDVLRDMRIDEVSPDSGGEVSYIDLELDLWVTDGVARWEDEEDVTRGAHLGWLPAADLVRIARTRDLLSRRHPQIIREVRRMLAALGVRPE
jgi:hypothetical protein